MGKAIGSWIYHQERQRRMRRRRFFSTHSREGSDCDYNSSMNAQPMHHGFWSQNFTTENVKESRNAVRKVDTAEGVSGVFGRILAVAALSSASDVFDLRHLLSYPITVPLSLANSDGTPLKTVKATLTNALESRQDVVFEDPIFLQKKFNQGFYNYWWWNHTSRVCDAAQQIHARNHGQGSVGESVLPSRRSNSSTTRQIQVYIHQWV